MVWCETAFGRVFAATRSREEEEGFVDLEKAAAGVAWPRGLIALTRPIDTLVVKLDYPSGQFGSQVLGIARSFPDFVETLD